MKMKLFAAAVAALAAGGAYAQSSVTLYGVVDAGVEWVNKVPNDVITPTAGGSRLGVQSGSLSGSRWGLRGAEDLGGGLKGIFTLESGFNIDDGKMGQGDRLFGRSAYIGLQSNWGQLTLGRQTNLLYDFALNYDPMALSSRYSIAAQDAFLAERADNSVKYTGTFKGVGVSALYSFKRSGDENVGADKAGREWSLGANYERGPFSVGAVYDRFDSDFDDVNSATVPVKEQRATIAGAYVYGPTKTYLGYRWYKAENAASNDLRSDLIWLGTGYQVTPALSLTGVAYYQHFKDVSFGSPWLFVASTGYALSKRTDAYFNVAFAKNSKGSFLGVNGMNSVDAAPGIITSLQPSANKANVYSGYGSPANTNNQLGAVVGIRHKF